MNDSAITLDFSFLGANHQRLDQSKNKSLQSEATVIENRYKSNTLQGFLINHVLNNINPGIYEVSYIPNISPINILLQNLDVQKTIWISCHKQPVNLDSQLEHYVVRTIHELLYLLTKLKDKDTSKNIVVVTHLSHIINNHLFDLIKHNNANNIKTSINDYKCKFLVLIFSKLSVLFDKTILINNFMNAKNSDYDSYVLKSELENGIVGKGVLDQVWKRMIHLKISIYNNVGNTYSIKLVVEHGANTGVKRIHTLYQYPEAKQRKTAREVEVEHTNIPAELEQKDGSVLANEYQYFNALAIDDNYDDSDDMIDDSQY